MFIFFCGRNTIKSSFLISYSISRLLRLSWNKIMDIAQEVQVLESPIKSEGDKKEYRVIKLPNGLKALLIKKNEEKTSESEILAAANLTVGVGSFDEPPNIGGLAHFLEHMLFMGSEKYPEESSYNQFISANGGSDNAMTENEFTTYFFDVSLWGNFKLG